MKFKVGDRVLVVKEENDRHIGDVGIITHVENDDDIPYQLNIENCYWFYENELKLVTKTSEPPIKPQLAVIIDGETYTMENLKDAYETTEDDIESTTTERDRLTEHLKTMRKWKKTLYNAMDMIGGKL